MRRRPGRLGHGLLGLLAALAVAACEPAPAPTGEPSPAISRDPLAVCALLPDVAAVVGREPIASPSGFSSETGDRCLWVLDRDPSRYVGLIVGSSANHAATIDAFGPGETVSGLGSDARWWATNRTLSVVTGEQSFQVDLQLEPGEATRELAEAIAIQVLTAMGAPPR